MLATYEATVSDVERETARLTTILATVAAMATPGDEPLWQREVIESGERLVMLKRALEEQRKGLEADGHEIAESLRAREAVSLACARIYLAAIVAYAQTGEEQDGGRQSIQH